MRFVRGEGSSVGGTDVVHSAGMATGALRGEKCAACMAFLPPPVSRGAPLRFCALLGLATACGAITAARLLGVVVCVTVALSTRAGERGGVAAGLVRGVAPVLEAACG